MAAIRVFVCFLILAVAVTECSHDLMKRQGFVKLGCMGVYDKYALAELDAICEECFQLYRDPDVKRLCKYDCFNSKYFDYCLAALKLSEQKEDLEIKVHKLYGRRK